MFRSGCLKLLFLCYRYEAGATYYLDRVGGYGRGWQTRSGGEWGAAFGFLKHGGLRYRDFDSNGLLQVDQVVHTSTVGTPLVNLSYSNDTEDSFPWASRVPWIPELEDGSILYPGNFYKSDRYRTASGRLRVGLLEMGFFLHTGEGEAIDPVSRIGSRREPRHFSGGNIHDPDLSNGIIYFGFGGIKVGWDSEIIRHTLQNRVAHDGLSIFPRYGNRYAWVLMTDRQPRFVFQFGSF